MHIGEPKRPGSIPQLAGYTRQRIRFCQLHGKRNLKGTSLERALAEVLAASLCSVPQLIDSGNYVVGRASATGLAGTWAAAATAELLELAGNGADSPTTKQAARNALSSYP